MHVEIWSDIACPWCYVGKRRFEAALAGFEHRDDVQVTWRSFELDPAAPPERDGDGAQHLADKYGMSRDEALAAQQRLTDVAAGEGLAFRFDLARGGNTFDAHRVLHLAAAHGLQDAMKERIMRAYLEEGELVSSHEVLERLAVEVGLPAEEVRELLAGDRFATRCARTSGPRPGSASTRCRSSSSIAGSARRARSPRRCCSTSCARGGPRSRVQVVAEGATCGPDGCP